MTQRAKRRAGANRIALPSTSVSGLRSANRHESAFRQALWAAVAMTPLAFWIACGRPEIAVLVGSMTVVSVVEWLNAGIEAVVDRVSPDRHELSKQAQNLAIAAVLSHCC